MIVVVCANCRTAVRIQGGEEEEMENLVGQRSEWYPDKFPCPSCDAKATVHTAVDAEVMNVLDIHDLTPAEAFVAFNGMGLPEEQECGPTAVNKAFSQPVKKINAKLIKGSNRSVLESIEFEDGTRLFLASSPYGATVYRISKPRSITEEVLNGTS